jgi:hypothetical protein
MLFIVSAPTFGAGSAAIQYMEDIDTYIVEPGIMVGATNADAVVSHNESSSIYNYGNIWSIDPLGSSSGIDFQGVNEYIFNGKSGLIESYHSAIFLD